MGFRATTLLASLALIAGCASDASTASSTSSAVPKLAPSAATTAATTVQSSATSTSALEAGRSPLSPDAWVACQCASGATEQIFLLHPDGSDEHRVLEETGGRQRHPDFSHDGQRLAFDIDTGASTEVWVADADGSNPRHVDVPCVLAGCIGVWEPAWSPDDRSLAVIVAGGPVVNDALTSVGVAAIDLTTNEMRIVVEQPGSQGQLQFPRWSPDGSQLVFWNETDEPTTWIVDFDGSNPRQLTAPDLEAGDPDWSPDGTKIVMSTKPLVHFNQGPSDLYTIAPDGSNLTQLTDSGGFKVRYTQPRWTPDGTAILYTRDVPHASRTIWARSLDGSHEGPIASTQRVQTHPVLQPSA